MSLLHPSDDDDAFAAGHADSGHRMSLNRIWRLTALLKEARHQTSPWMSHSLVAEIDALLATTHYDEPDDGHWRLGPHDPKHPPPPLPKP